MAIEKAQLMHEYTPGHWEQQDLNKTKERGKKVRIEEWKWKEAQRELKKSHRPNCPKSLKLVQSR